MDATRAIQVAVVRADMFIVGTAKYGRIALAALLAICLWAIWRSNRDRMGW